MWLSPCRIGLHFSKRNKNRKKNSSGHNWINAYTSQYLWLRHDFSPCYYFSSLFFPCDLSSLLNIRSVLFSPCHATVHSRQRPDPLFRDPSVVWQIEMRFSLAGGYKGYGLAMMVDVFSGVLSGSAFGTNIRKWKGDDEKIADLVIKWFAFLS